MFEQFPYTDMHQLNLDWIIKIAKDFLDQYTGIQQLIEDGEQSLNDATQDGLNDLQEKAETLQGLLDAWYTEHSADIANELAAALQDLNTWYTTHQGYLDTYLSDSITAFNTAADAKAAETIASIPDDYTALANKVTNMDNFITPELTYTEGYISTTGITSGSNRYYSNFVPCMAGDVIQYIAETHHASVSGISFWDADKNFIYGIQNNGENGSVQTVTVTKQAGKNDPAYCAISILAYQYTAESAYIKIARVIDRGVFANETVIMSKKIKDVENLNEYSVILDGIWTQYSVSELNGVYYIEDNDKVQIKSLNSGAYRMAYTIYDSDDQVLSTISWSTADILDVITTGLTGISYFKIRLQNASGSGNISENAYKDLVVAKDTKIVNTVIENARPVMYVDTATGLDSNDGTSRATALKSIQAAINKKGSVILVKAGTYEAFRLNNMHDVSIMVDHEYDTFETGVTEDYPLIVLDGQAHYAQIGISIVNSSNITLSGFEIKDYATYGIRVQKSANVTIRNCIVHDIYDVSMSNVSGGMSFDKSDANCYDCTVYNIGTDTTGAGTRHCDGYNIHNTGTVNLFNCNAYNCEDDGVSHHDASRGLIDGGEWHHNGKGGIASPTYGAKVNIQNVYSHDNEYGIYALGSGLHDRGNILINSSVFVNNSTKDITASDFYYLVLINCVYGTISGNHVTRYPNT